MSWPQVQLAIWLVAAGVALCNAALGGMLAFAHRRDPSYRVTASILLLIAIAVGTQASAPLTAHDATILALARLGYGAIMLLVPAALWLAGQGLSRRVRRSLVSVATAASLAVLVDPLVFTGYTAVTIDAWGGHFETAELSPYSAWLVAYAAVVGVTLLCLVRRRGIDPDMRRGLRVVTAASVLGGLVDLAADAGLIAAPRVGPVAYAIASTAILHVVQMRTHAAHRRLLDAQARLVGLQDEASAEKRRVERLAALGETARTLIEQIGRPVRRLVQELGLLSERFATLSLAGAGGMGDVIDAAQDAAEASRRLRDTTSRVHAFATADVSGEGSCHVGDALSDAIQLLQNELRHRVRLSVDASGDARVHGNEARLTQLFILVVRAGAYRFRELSQDVHVTLTSDEDHAVLEVASEDHETVVVGDFDPYTEPSITMEGFGLDLATAHRLATAFGGSVGQEAVDGHLVLRVTLPLEEGSS